MATLLALDVLLCAAIVLLEYHYFVDLLGGVAVAALAILMVDRRSHDRPKTRLMPVVSEPAIAAGGNHLPWGKRALRATHNLLAHCR